MKRFFKRHPETILIAFAILFVAAIIGFYFWGVGDILATTNHALNYAPPQPTTGFDLQGASQLDLRGLVK